MKICEECKEEFKKILNQRIKDILACRDEEEDYPAQAHCFHLMEIERMLDGKPVAFSAVQP